MSFGAFTPKLPGQAEPENICAELYGVDMTEIDSRIDKMASLFDLDRRSG